MTTDPTLAARVADALVLADGITPGPWQYELDNICQGYEFRDGKHVATWIAEIDHMNREDYADNGYESRSEQADRDARAITQVPELLALVRDLAAALAAAGAREARLAEALKGLMETMTPILQRSYPKSAWADAWEQARLALEADHGQ